MEEIVWARQCDDVQTWGGGRDEEASVKLQPILMLSCHEENYNGFDYIMEGGGTTIDEVPSWQLPTFFFLEKI